MKLAPFRHFQAQVSLEVSKFLLNGSDAVSFIQGQSTQKLDQTPRVHAFVDRTAKIESHFLAWQSDTQVILLVPRELAKAVKKRLEGYVISEDVTWEISEEKWWLAAGPGKELPGVSCEMAGEATWLASSPFTGLPIESEDQFNQWLSWQGWPSLDKSFGEGEVINQTRLFETAVSLTKGCFPGQEAVAKIQNLKGAAWAPKLLRVEIQGAGEVPRDILIDGKKIVQLGVSIQAEDKLWFQAKVLRDVRVDGAEFTAEGWKFKISPFPLWPWDKTLKAQELFYLGSQAFQEGHEEDALSIWKRSLEIDPTFADAYEAIGVLLGRQKRYVEADAWMRKLLEVDPESIMAHTNLSLFLMQQGKIEEAEEHKSLATVASFGSFGKSSALDQKRIEEEKKKAEELSRREKLFLEVMSIDPEDTLANYGLGDIALEKKNYVLARKYLEKVIQVDSNYSVAYLSLGKTLIGLDEKDRAREILAQGIKTAAKKGEFMPANEMQTLLSSIS